MNGIIVIDKPVGKTSHYVVTQVKKLLNVKKAGHTGTLDPLATGVLPVCLGEATKLVQFLASDDKDYKATMLLGVKTDTFDIEGRIISQGEPNLDKEAIEKALKNLIGKIQQTPPRYSGIKFQGKPFYKWARKGFAMEPMPRIVEIYNITMEQISLPYVTFRISCSKGTYIRSICSDIGEVLGCGGCLAELRRTKSGLFPEEKALSLENAQKEKNHKLLEKWIISMVDILPNVPAIEIEPLLAEKIREGCQPTVDIIKNHYVPSFAAGGMVRFISYNTQLIAIGKALYDSDDITNATDGKRQAIKISRVFNSGQ
jgi:tRNA pseudouridine55 synthase